MLHLGPVVAGGLFVEFSAMQNPAAFFIKSAEDKPSDPREADGRRAHRAGLQRHVQIIFRDALCVRLLANLADDQHLGMGRGIAQFDGAIAGPRGDFSRPGIDQHGADRHFIPLVSGFCLFQRGV